VEAVGSSPISSTIFFFLIPKKSMTAKLSLSSGRTAGSAKAVNRRRTGAAISNNQVAGGSWRDLLRLGPQIFLPKPALDEL
jgi:hypothetical protein